jgi:sugar transferase (PEP-CTERM/EpsH1 system associated)
MTKKRIFVIASRVPYPLDKGDKLRIYHQVKELSVNFNVCLLVLSDGKVDVNAQLALEKIAEKVVIIQLKRWLIPFQLLRAFLSDKPFQVWYFYQKWAHKLIREEINKFQPDFIFCQLIRAAEYVKFIHHIPKSIDYMDAFSKGIERRIEGAGWQRFLFRMEHKRLLKYENLIYDYFEHHMIISNEDRNYILHPSRDKIAIVPNGVDHQFFKSLGSHKKYDIVFVGNMNYPPNVDAAIFLAHNILPKLKAHYPEITLLIAGASPAAEVAALQTDNIVVSGWMEDIRMAYDSAHIFVAPLRIGTGLQNKLLEAMAMELPCVTSALAAKALIGKGTEHVLIANTLDEYVRCIIDVLDNKMLQNELGSSARKYVIENYSWQHNTQPLVMAIQQIRRSPVKS